METNIYLQMSDNKKQDKKDNFYFVITLETSTLPT